MNAAILTLVLLYILFSIYLGIWTHKRNKDSSDDYYVASRSVGWFHLGVTIFATWFSTFTFLGAPGFFYAQGVKWYASYAFYTFAGVLLFWFFSRKIWLLGSKNSYITPADLLADFYKSEFLRYLVAIISIVALIPYCLIQLVGIGKAIEGATNGFAPYNLVIIATGIVTAFYVYVGGVRAILWTDIIQGVLFGVVILIAMCVAITAAGGFFEGFEKSVRASPDLFIFADGDSMKVITISLIWTLGFITLPHLWQRSYMAKTAEHLVKSSVVVSIVAIFLITALMITGVFGMSFMQELQDSDKFISSMFLEYFHYALPLFVLAAFASGMSTVDSQLLTASSIFVRDLVKPFKKNLNTKVERKLGQYFLLALIVLLVVLALLPEAQGPVITLATKGTGLAVMLFVPLLGPTYVPSANRHFTIAALLISSIYYILAEFKLIDFSFGLSPFLAALLVNFVIFFFPLVLGKLTSSK